MEDINGLTLDVTDDDHGATVLRVKGDRERLLQLHSRITSARERQVSLGREPLYSVFPFHSHDDSLDIIIF